MSEIRNINVNSSHDDSEDDNSDDNLKIVLESPIRKRTDSNSSTGAEKESIESFKDKIEKSLEEKAAKTNLNAINVKTIIRKVVNNEHLVALIQDAENTEDKEVYEPKLTRAKAKELSANSIPSVPWITTVKKKSEVEVLLRDDLQEDSSGDEYVPCEEDSEDDKESTIVSDHDPLSVSASEPATPTKNIDSSTQTNWSEDGLFKIPETMDSTVEEKANIALRTRSKLSLSSTPLEVIEEAFIPPDITTDMYDMDCDDDDWRDFLKKFTRPLDEVTKATEEEDHDPEYNAEEVEEVDREELRMDKGVKVTRKELNDLIAELFEFTDNYEMENKKKTMQTTPEEIVSQQAELPKDENVDCIQQEIIIEAHQIPLLEQQLRQHVQLLAQNFLLTYEHPELHQDSYKYKEYLLNLKFLGEGKKVSAFYITNLNEALRIVHDWEEMFSTSNVLSNETKDFVQRELVKSSQRRTSGKPYIPQFPPALLKTVSESTVFLYVHLLPRIPFKPLGNFSGVRKTLLPSEEHLIALGLEQFIPYAKQFPLNITQKGHVKLLAVAELIQKYMMPHVPAIKLYHHIITYKRLNQENNPIKFYFTYGKLQQYVHYVFPLNVLHILPPCKRDVEELPKLWADFIYPIEKIEKTKKNVQIIPQQPVYDIIYIQRYIPSNEKLILPNGKIPSSPKKRGKHRPSTKTTLAKTQRTCNKLTPFESFVKCMKKPLNIFGTGYFTVGENYDPLTMLPSMPCLGTPVKNSPSELNENANNAQVNYFQNNVEIIPQIGQESESEINSCSSVQESNEDECFISTSYHNDNDKDNPDDINALMEASANLKSIRTKPSGAEKKRAKIRREFTSNLLISTPENPAVEKEKNHNFALAYYDKMREVLKMDDYHKMMQILNEHEGDAIELYRKIEPILKPNYEQLYDEFLLFLREKEAAAIGKLIPWLHMNVRSKFLRKLETYFKNQPIQLRRIYKCLTELSQTVNVSMDKIKTTLIPLLKGNSTLIDLFMQNFLSQSPPASLLESSYETIDLHKEMSRPDNEEIYETIAVPEAEDKYGGMNCTCSCHEIEDHEFKSRYRHCIPCGTRFMQGKVYIQSGRGLRPATISFPTSPNVDHNIRLNGKPSSSASSSSAAASQRKKRSETSPSKQVTVLPIKECAADEETDDDVDGKSKTKKKSPRKRKKQPDKQIKTNKDTQKKISSKKIFTCDQLKTDDSLCQKDIKLIIKRNSGGTNKKLKCKNDKDDVKLSSSSRERDFNEVDAMDWDGTVELKATSPEHNTAESESEFCEESSQDNCGSDTNSSVSSSNAHSQSDANEEICWKREEDKIILETFKQENEKEEAFKIISQQLKNRTVSQIRNRFQTLLNLIMEQIAERK